MELITVSIVAVLTCICFNSIYYALVAKIKDHKLIYGMLSFASLIFLLIILSLY